MQEINLLRPLIEQSQEIAKSRGRYSFYITFTLIVLISITTIILGAKFYLSAQKKSLTAKKASLERDLSEVKQIEDNINDFNNAISQLKSVDKNKALWSTVYDNIAKSTPQDIKLTQVSQVTGTKTATTTASNTAAAAAIKLKITGETKSRRSIALFAYKLQKISPSFVAVEIISSKRTESQTTQTSNLTPEELAAKAAGYQAAGKAGGEVTNNSTTTEEKIDFEINLSLKSS